MSSTLAISSTNPAVSRDLDSVFSGATVIGLNNIGWLRVSGEDRVRWLNGMATNSIQALQPGEGCYNFFLNAQGRILADGTAFAEADSLLIETGLDRLPGLITLLDHFIIMDDVELATISQGRAGLLVAGPHAASLLTKMGLSVAPSQAPFLERHVWKSAQIDLIHAYSPLVPRFELWAETDVIAQISDALLDAGAIKASTEILETLRVLEGTPLYGTDIREKELPQETAQTRALHFAKGCYLGQEIVERIRSRGNVHRTFTGFLLTGERASAGAALAATDAPDKPIGELTSVAEITLPGETIQVALGYIRREAIDLGRTIDYPGGEAKPISLPFQFARTLATNPTQAASD